MSAKSHAPSDVARRPLYLGLVVTFAACALGAGAAFGLLYAGRGRATLMRRRDWYMQVPAEVAQVELVPLSVADEVSQGNATARAQLSSYGWIDRDAGVIHVPVEVAIELYLATQRGPSR